MKINLNKYIITLIAGCVLTATSCNKYLDIPLPVNSIAGDAAFISDASSSSVVTGLFTQMSTAGYIYGPANIEYTTALYADETRNLNLSDANLNAFYTDALIGSGTSGTTQWSAMYPTLYQVNLAIEKLSSGTGNLINRNQWLGECYFLRAYLFLMLTNLYGDVPLTLTSNVLTNRTIANSSQPTVYQQIISDLKNAQSLLSSDYKDGYSVTTTDRSRPNNLSATALLARVYLYLGDWSNAEAQSNQVINNAAFQLVPLSQTFLIGSKESIWCLATLTGSTQVVSEYTLYNNGMPAVIPAGKQITSYGPAVCLSNDLVNTFEANDNRLVNWVRQTVVPAAGTTAAVTYYFPNKYKSATVGSEYNVVLRLAEQYLIRAEARAQQNNISGAQADLNAVRTRAGLSNTNAATKSDLVSAILKERRTELFTEFGHRFFDLKRTKTIDAVMGGYAPLKGGSWSSYKQFWPRPITDLQTDPNIQQTPGY